MSLSQTLTRGTGTSGLVGVVMVSGEGEEEEEEERELLAG